MQNRSYHHRITRMLVALGYWASDRLRASYLLKSRRCLKRQVLVTHRSCTHGDRVAMTLSGTKLKMMLASNT